MTERNWLFGFKMPASLTFRISRKKNWKSTACTIAVFLDFVYKARAFAFDLDLV